MMKKICYILCCLTILLGCNQDPTFENPNYTGEDLALDLTVGTSASGTFTAKVDGADFKASAISINTLIGLTITGSGPNGAMNVISLEEPKTGGTFDLAGNYIGANDTDAEAILNGAFESGSISFETYDAEKGIIKATFSGALKSGVKITEGKIDVTFTPKKDDTPSSDSFVGSWKLVEFGYEGSSTSEAGVTTYDATASNINAFLEFKESGSYVSSGSYDISIKTTFNGTTFDIPASVNDFTAEGTWKRNGNDVDVENKDGKATAEILELSTTRLKMKATKKQVISQGGTNVSIDITTTEVYDRVDSIDNTGGGDDTGGGDTGGGDTGGGDEAFSATVNGVDFELESAISSKNSVSVGGIALTTYSFMFTDKDRNIITLSINEDLKEKQYTFSSSPTGGNLAGYQEGFVIPDYGPGKLTVTKHDVSKKEVHGTFEFTVSAGVVKGSFKQTYTEQSADF